MGQREADIRSDDQVRAEDRSLGDLFSDLSRDFSELIRKEVELAKMEVREEVTKAGKSAAMLGAGGILAYLAVLLGAFAAAWGLAEVIPTGFAFLAVAAAVGLVAAVLLASGRSKARQIKPVPDETLETLKEDAQWAKAQVK